jgi:hypothetical protein
MPAGVFRRELVLGDIVSHTLRIAFGRVAPSLRSAEDVPEHVASPDRKPTFCGQFAHLCPGEDIGGVRVAPGRAVANAETILTAVVVWCPTLQSHPTNDGSFYRPRRHRSVAGQPSLRSVLD